MDRLSAVLGVALVVAIGAFGVLVSKTETELSSYRGRILNMVARENICDEKVIEKDGLPYYRCNVYLLDHAADRTTWYELIGVTNRGYPLFVSLTPSKKRLSSSVGTRIPDSCLQGTGCEIVRKDDSRWNYMHTIMTGVLKEKYGKKV